MKQPLMIIPPAQAEALYDFALEGEQHERLKRAIINSRPEDDWDDGTSSDYREMIRPANSGRTHLTRVQKRSH